MGQLLACWDNENKDTHGKHCHNKQRDFSLSTLSVDGMLGKEAPVVLSNLSRIITEKPEEPISHERGWFNGRITIHCHEVVLLHDQRILPSHSPAGPVSGMEFEIGP